MPTDFPPHDPDFPDVNEDGDERETEPNVMPVYE